MLKRIARQAIFVAAIIATISLTGCSGVSEEQIAELEALRAEVKSLDSQVNSLNSQKESLEKEIAEKNARLEECAKMKTETQENLEKLGLK